MKRHLLTLGALALSNLFYFAIVGLFIDAWILLTAPDLFSVVVLVVLIIVLGAYWFAFKKYPRFRNLLFFSLENNGPMS